MFRHLCSLGLLWVLVGCTSGGGVFGMGGDKTNVDQVFVRDAASGGLMEIQSGQLAAQRAGNDELKSFGQMMVGDHTKAHAELKAAAAKDGLKVTDTMTPADQKTVDRLGTLKGGDFDREYARVIVDSHEKTIASFEQEVNQGKKRAVKDFAQRTLPQLRQHLDRARAIGPKIK